MNTALAFICDGGEPSGRRPQTAVFDGGGLTSYLRNLRNLRLLLYLRHQSNPGASTE